MTSAAIVLDTHFLAQVQDANRWEERFDVLVRELCDEYGQNFLWSDRIGPEPDIVFVLYPPSQHQRMVADRVLEHYVSSRYRISTHVHVAVIGRNSKNSNVRLTDVADIVNDQCTAYGVKAASLRVLRPEGLDDDVRKTLVRLFTRRQGGSPRPSVDQPRAESTDVTHPGYAIHPHFESSDL